MWPGQQPPGGEQNPQNDNPYQQPGYQQPNPYQQPGYQQPNPYQQPGQQQWNAPTVPGTSAQPPSGGGGGNRTKLVAIVAATAVVVAAGVTGFLVLGKDKDGDGKDVKATSSASHSAKPSPTSTVNPRDPDTDKPVIDGWKTVINPRWGTAFDVPPDWSVQSPDTLIGFEKDGGKASDPPLITMSAPAYYKEKWCTADEDKDGNLESTRLATAGTKGSSGAKDAADAAIRNVPWWVFGGYTQPDKKSLTFDKTAKSYTTVSGVEGAYAWARSKNTPQKGKCASDGKAITFGFKNSKGDLVAWNFYGATGVTDEVPDDTVMKILSTVRLHGDPTGE
ncbi:hypothetical protein AB0L85_21930 [Streptomyces sp. NPDC052051]|uniref:hypothetical protein n=1 Tax=Streptomyces sp. NPDC052051 TaxID=3154649 RepID=UPI003415BB7F